MLLTPDRAGPLPYNNQEADATASASQDHFTKQYDARYDDLKPNEKPRVELKDPLDKPIYSDPEKTQLDGPDWIWKTTVPTGDGWFARKLEAGSSKGTKCCALKDGEEGDAQIMDCVRAVAQKWAGSGDPKNSKNWSVWQNCQNFVKDVLSKCCMDRVNPPEKQAARQR